MSPSSSSSEPSRETHLHYLSQALSLARLSPPKPTNFRVGCVLVSFPPSPDPSSSTTTTGDSVQGEILCSGYTLELEGNTHAEQNALGKLASKHNISRFSDERLMDSDEKWSRIFPPELNVYLYTTIEPCGLRLSGSTPCVQRILFTRVGNPQGGVRKVIFGAREPGTFVQDSQSLKMLDDAGVAWEHVQGLDEEILRVAREGHVKSGDEKVAEQGRTGIDDISAEERRRQEALPRNPKKRMMEVDLAP